MRPRVAQTAFGPFGDGRCARRRRATLTHRGAGYIFAIMAFDQAIEYVTAALKFGINPGLERAEKACALLGNPQRNYSVVQVTGTNGKTSSSRMIAAILREHGLKVGLYTSPHLSSYTERIAVDGREISETDFVEAIAAAKPALDETASLLGELTEFEILTVAALNFFASAGVDVAVLEVGLGGRWDATSVARPRVAVVTNVDLDHADRLGSTVSEIARDKAHIVKEGSMAVGGNLSADALREVEDRCKSVGSKLFLLGRDFRLSEVLDCPRGSLISVEGLFGTYRGLELNMIGAFQRANAAIAIAASEALMGIALSECAAAKALSAVSCPGRMEIISREPFVMVDGAHNPAGARELVASLRAVLGKRKPVFVVSISSDKDIAGIIGELAGFAERFVFTENDSYRSAGVGELIAKAKGSAFDAEPDLRRAIEKALEIAKGRAVVITGSLYAVGEAREALAKILGDRALDG